MKIRREDLKAAALDARLNLSEEEEETLLERVNSLAGSMLMYRQVLDLSGELPLFYPHNFKNFFREDIPETSLAREEVLENGPDTDTSCFRVPRIVEDL